MGNPAALIVEDNRDVARHLARAIQEAGFETEIILTGDETLNRLVAVVPDLVVLDLQLPGVQGADILAHIRSDPRLRETRVMVVTGNSQRAENLGDGADLVLLKPVGFDQLRDLAARLKTLDGGPV